MSTVWKTLKIFVSSTFRDLELERDKLSGIFHNVERHVLERQLVIRPYDLRWRDRNSQEPVAEWCMRMVEECDYFIGILGFRYGWRPPTGPDGKPNAENISVTEMEVRKAIEKVAPEHRFFCFPSFASKEGESVADIASVISLKKRLQDSGEKVFVCNSLAEMLSSIKTQFQKIVDKEYPPGEKVAPLVYTYRQALDEMVAEKIRGFVGRQAYLDKLKSFALATDRANYLGIHAVAGTGKSALLAQFIHTPPPSPSPCGLFCTHIFDSQFSCDNILLKLEIRIG
jgi:hypothetical protein